MRKFFLGQPPADIKKWIEDHAGPEPGPTASDGKVLYRTVVGGEWLQTDADITDGTFNGFSEKESAVEVIIPSKDSSGNKVTSVGNQAFFQCSMLTNATIPDSMTTIGNNAFYNCSGLTSVTIPDSVTSIGNYAFYNCSWLVSVTIGNGVTSIESSAFNGCSSLTNVIIGSSVTSIGDYAFRGCGGLTSVTIPDSVTNISGGAFYGCHQLRSVMFEGNAPIVRTDAFARVASGCKAVISLSATGFPEAGQIWKGLIVEVKS